MTWVTITPPAMPVEEVDESTTSSRMRPSGFSSVRVSVDCPVTSDDVADRLNKVAGFVDFLRLLSVSMDTKDVDVVVVAVVLLVDGIGCTANEWAG